LFDSLTVAENVGYQLSEDSAMPVDRARARVEEVLAFVGLSEFVDRLPSQLSGGQRRRVAIARAIAPAPGLLLFDDPISGLDPILAKAVDNEILKLRDLEHVTSIVVTHQIRDAYYIATHQAVRVDGRIQFNAVDAAKAAQVEFMVLDDGRIRFQGSASQLMASDDPFLKKYLLMTLPPWSDQSTPLQRPDCKRASAA